MKEFDFDELDKAVSSLMGNVKKTDDTQKTATLIQSQPDIPPVPTPTDDASEQAIAPIDNADVVYDTPLAPEEPVPEISVAESISPVPKPVETIAASAPLAARRGGRFMDVVHPSSDMKLAAPTRVPSREGNTLQPVAARSVESTTASNSTIIDTTITSAPAPRPESSVSIDSVPETESEHEEVPTAEPWSSPFLPDAQVEKRPLGGLSPASETGLSNSIAEELSKVIPVSPSGTTPSSEPAVEEEVSSDEEVKERVDTDDLQLAPDPSDAPLPAELNNDLVAIESGQKSTELESTDPLVAPVETPTSTLSPSTVATAAMTTGSISPQYNEQPSTGDSSHLPIYDNEAIHQPLAHPPKKKKGLVIIIMIILVMLLGGGLGFLAYFLGLL